MKHQENLIKKTLNLSFLTESAEQKILNASGMIGLMSTAPLSSPDISK